MPAKWIDRLTGRSHKLKAPQQTMPAPVQGDALHTLDVMMYAEKLTKIETKKDPLLLQIFGTFRQNPSFLTSNTRDPLRRDYAHEIVKPRDRTAFVTLMGEMHEIFKRKLTNSVKIELDEKALPQKIQELIDRLRTNRAAYQAEMHSMLEAAKQKKGERHVSETEMVANKTIQDLLYESEIICNGLTQGLDKDCRTIPLIIDGVKEEFPNNGKMGGGIFALHNASANLMNTYMVPDPLKNYYCEHLKGDDSGHFRGQQAGTKGDIAKGMRRILAGTSLAERYDTALAAQMPAIKESLHKGAHSLQILYLLKDHPDIGYGGGEAAKRLLQIAGEQEYPASLQSPAEMKLVLEALSGKHPPSLAAKILNLKEVDFNVDAAKANALSLLDALPARRGRNYDDYNKQLELARAYLQPVKHVDMFEKPEQPGKGI